MLDAKMSKCLCGAASTLKFKLHPTQPHTVPHVLHVFLSHSHASKSIFFPLALLIIRTLDCTAPKLARRMARFPILLPMLRFEEISGGPALLASTSLNAAYALLRFR